LEAALQKNSVGRLKALASWARESIASVNSALIAGKQSELRWSQAPKWDLGQQKEGSKSQYVNTGPELLAGLGGGGADLKDEYETRMRALRRELEAKIKSAWEEAERERQNAREALEHLAEESAKADNTLAELRRKIAMLEALLRDKGLGKQAADAMWGAGLTEFVQGRDVFERLYRDALDRMRRSAEAQKRFFEECSLEFLKTVSGIMDPRLKFPGMDTRYLVGLEGDDGASPASIGGSRRSIGGGSPSRSPPGSPTNASRSSPRRVVTAPSRMGAMAEGENPLSVARLTGHSNGAAPVGKTSAERPRTENSGKTHSVASSVAIGHGPVRASGAANRDRPDMSLMIGLVGGPASLQDAKRPASQSFIAQAMTKNRQLVPPRHVALWDGKMLPPLECKGQGHPGARSRSPSNDEAEDRMRKHRGLRSGSPVREAKFDREQMLKLMNRDLLSIKSSVPMSGLLPPHMSPEPRASSAAKIGGTRPNSQVGTIRVPSRQGGALSMPHLGPPRLLVQSVAAAY
jgi:hypothetical protein